MDTLGGGGGGRGQLSSALSYHVPPKLQVYNNIILTVAAISPYSTHVYTDVVAAAAHATTNHRMSSIRPAPLATGFFFDVG